MTSMPSMPSDPNVPGPGTGSQWSDAERDMAMTRIQKKRAYRAALAAYVLVNLGLIAIWAASGFGYFWPGWVIGGWGLGMAMAGWDLYFRKPITQEDIDRELRGQQHPAT